MTNPGFAELQIVNALSRARTGIARYLNLMDLFPTVNVSADLDFQRQYNGFYKVRQRPSDWYKTYYHIMQDLRDQKPSFDEVLDLLHSRLGRCEASFASKMVATLDAHRPVWDTWVLKNMRIKPLTAGSPQRFEQAKANYTRIQEWHDRFLASENGRLVVSVFRNMVPQHAKVTDLKKVDFFLWKNRPEKAAVSEELSAN